MRSQWLLLPLLGALVGSAGADLAKRQNDETTAASAGDPVPTTTGGNDGSTPPDTTSPEEPSSEPTTTGGGGGDETTSDTTTTITTTVGGGGGGGSTETTRTTVVVTRPTTVVVVVTDFETTTVTEQNGDGTATRTVYETTTVQGNNERRALEDVSQTLAQVEAVPTNDAPAPTGDVDLEMVKRGPKLAHLAKRATVTVIRTVTDDGGNGNDETVTDTTTRTVFDTTTTRSTTTIVNTETDEVGATTTETVTSTLTVTSSDVTTGVTEPTGGSGDGGNNDNSDDGGGGGGGLSTGAKAGIGAGVGVAGLVLLAGLGWFCFKKRRGGSKPTHDDMFGSSEVPVGAATAGGAGGAAMGAAAAGRHTPPMSHSHSTSTAGGLAPSSAASKSHAAEGYRGTAMGDGRAGYAKPEPYGAAYTRASGISRSPVSGMAGYSRPTDAAPGDHLPEHSTPAEMESVSSPQTAELGAGGTAHRWDNAGAAEIDGQPALNTQSGPVYEMPSQPYR